MKTEGRPRRMLLDWIFDKDSKQNYQTVRNWHRIEKLDDVGVPDLLDDRELEEVIAISAHLVNVIDIQETNGLAIAL